MRLAYPFAASLSRFRFKLNNPLGVVLVNIFKFVPLGKKCREGIVLVDDLIVKIGHFVLA